MKVGDKVVAVRTFGEFESTFEGVIISFYNNSCVVVRTSTGNEWIFKKSDIRYAKEGSGGWCQ